MPPEPNTARMKTRPRPDWSKADWSQRNADIAAALRCTVVAVIRHRKLHNLPPAPKHEIPWHLADWSQPDVAIAAVLKCSPAGVREHRARHGHPAAPSLRKQPDWSSVDWTKRNIDIARHLGLSVHTVAGYRAKHSLPPSPLGRAATRPKPHRRVFLEWDGIDWALPNRIIAQHLGCTPQAVVNARARIHGSSGAGTKNWPRILAALGATLRGKTPNLDGISPAELQDLAGACTRLRAACLAAGGKKPRVQGIYKAPRTGLTRQVHAALASHSGSFTVADIARLFPNATRQQIANAIAHAVRIKIARRTTGSGTQSRIYEPTPNATGS